MPCCEAWPPCNHRHSMMLTCGADGWITQKMASIDSTLCTNRVDCEQPLTCIAYNSIHDSCICHSGSHGSCANQAPDPPGPTHCAVSTPGGFEAYHTTACSWHPDTATTIIACTHECVLLEQLLTFYCTSLWYPQLVPTIAYWVPLCRLYPA